MRTRREKRIYYETHEEYRVGHSAHGRGYFLQTVPKSLESYDVTAAQYAKRFEGADRVLVQAYITHKGPKNKNFVALKTRATRDDQNVYEWAPPQNSLEVNEAEEGKEDSNTLLDELTDIVGIDLGLKIRTIVKVIESMSDQPTVVGLKHGSHSAKPYPIVSFVLTVDSDSRYGPDGLPTPGEQKGADRSLSWISQRSLMEGKVMRTLSIGAIKKCVMTFKKKDQEGGLAKLWA